MRNTKASLRVGWSLFGLVIFAATTPVAAQVTALDDEPAEETNSAVESLDPEVWGEIDLPMHWRPFNPIVGASVPAGEEHECPDEKETT